jgi:light-regulated signal transduction histidine kinase (bacteriophytochrome)
LTLIQALPPAFGTAALSNCEREQFHLAASIQPQGALLLASEPDGGILQARANAAEFLGIVGGLHGLILRMWRAFLERLERLATDPSAAADAERAAIGTFAEFEHWMSGWKAIIPSTIDESVDRTP